MWSNRQRSNAFPNNRGLIDGEEEEEEGREGERERGRERERETERERGKEGGREKCTSTQFHGTHSHISHRSTFNFFLCWIWFTASVAVRARSALPLVEHHSGAPVSCLSRCSPCVVHSGAKLDINGAGVSILSTNHFGTPWAVIVLAVLDFFFVSGHCHFRTSMYIVLDVPIKRLVIARSLEMCISLLCQNGAPVRDAFKHVEPPRGITTDTWYWQELAVVPPTARPCAGIGKSYLLFS